MFDLEIMYQIFDLEMMYLCLPILVSVLITVVIYKRRKDRNNKEDEQR